MSTSSYAESTPAPAPAPTPTSPLAARLGDIVLSAARVVFGLSLATHGAQKLFGWLTDPAAGGGGRPPLASLPGVAGVLEFFGGLLLAAGLFTRPVAFVLSGLMAVAYFKAHAPRGFWPILNRGEPAVLYCFAFLVFWALGPGRYSVDGLVRRRP